MLNLGALHLMLRFVIIATIGDKSGRVVMAPSELAQFFLERSPMRISRRLLIVLGLLLLVGLLAACEKEQEGPEADVTVRAVIGRLWYDCDPLRFEVMDQVGNRFEIYVDESTIVNSAKATEYGTGFKEFEWSDLQKGDEMDMWLNEIDKDKGYSPKHYIALRLDISSTARR